MKWEINAEIYKNAHQVGLEMKKIVFGLLALGFSLSIQAKVCEIPMKQIQVGSIKLMQSFGDFKKIHPSADARKDSVFMLDIDYAFAREGVMFVGSIDYDSINNRIIGFTLSYTDGKYADNTTPINQFKNSILINSNLPKTGWVLSKDKEEYQYSCNDYKVHIRQDHGASRGAIGPVVWVFSRYSDFF